MQVKINNKLLCFTRIMSRVILVKCMHEINKLKVYLVRNLLLYSYKIHENVLLGLLNFAMIMSHFLSSSCHDSCSYIGCMHWTMVTYI